MEQVVINRDLTPAEPEGHEAKMVAKAEEGLNPQPALESTDEKKFAGKYKTVEDLEKGYGELVKLLGKQGKLPAENPVQPESESAPKENETPPVSPINYDKYTQEFIENGGLSEESYAELERNHIPRHIVDTYIDGLVTIAETKKNAVYSISGSKENHEQIMRWAADNLSQDEINAFNRIIEGHDLEQIKTAVSGIVYKYEKLYGRPPKLFASEDSLPNSSGDYYKDISELTADMAKPEYRKSEAFRKQVERKLANSKIM